MKKINFKTFFDGIIELTKKKIADYAYVTLTNEQKKSRLDTAIYDYVLETMSKYKFGFVNSFVIKNFLIPYIPVITQYIYDLLKARIDGVTKKEAA